MSARDDEPPHKVPRVLMEKDRSKRLIVILEHASLETVKVINGIITVYKLKQFGYYCYLCVSSEHCYYNFLFCNVDFAITIAWSFYSLLLLLSLSLLPVGVNVSLHTFLPV